MLLVGGGMSAEKNEEGCPLLKYGASAFMEMLRECDGLACWIKDRDGVIRWANKALLERFSEDADPSVVIGKTDYELVPKQLADQYRADDNLVRQGQPVLNREEWVSELDQVPVWSVVSKFPIRDAEGNILGTVGASYRYSEKSSWSRNPALSKVMKHIRGRYRERPDNAELAALVGMSAEALVALFWSELKMKPQDYVRRATIWGVCTDLVDMNATQEELARRHGYGDRVDLLISDFFTETGETLRVYRMKLFQRGAVRM
jgi:hypothetical protein